VSQTKTDEENLFGVQFHLKEIVFGYLDENYRWSTQPFNPSGRHLTYSDDGSANMPVLGKAFSFFSSFLGGDEPAETKTNSNTNNNVSTSNNSKSGDGLAQQEEKMVENLMV
jgi:hypothetical protein